MPRPQTLPLVDEWTDPDTYVDELLSFATSSDLFRHLCGGVHILDFFTREPDLYTSLLPETWRDFFEAHDTQDVLDLLLRDEVKPLLDQARCTEEEEKTWRGAAFPPTDLLEYIHHIRRFSLRRDFHPPHAKKPTIPRKIAVGMNVKKYHEVAHFSEYVDALCNTVDEQRGEEITHVVDFGSGQSYLGRTLASAPYNRHIVAIERKHQFINGANRMDIYAKLSEKKVVNMYNKRALEGRIRPKNMPKSEPDTREATSAEAAEDETADTEENGEATMINVFRDISLTPNEIGADPHKNTRTKPKPDELSDANGPRGAMDYIEHEIKDGYLEPIIKDVVESPAAGGQENAAAATTETKEDARVMVVSLHSCGNLLHHGVRSLTLNPSVKAIAMIGCCYNLVTERLGPATYKIPVLRTMHPRLTKDAVAYDPHGFPMSKRLEDYEHESGTGMKLNITARSMSLQAPYNWDRESSENFFTRHFYRTLLQRMLMDRGVIEKPSIPTDLYGLEPTPSESASGEKPLVVGSLRKAAFASFPAYAQAAIAKLSRDPTHGENVKSKMADLTEEELDRYVAEYWPRKKQLSVTWALMSFSAALVEAIIVVDRWQFLREHESVKDCWVEPVFDYSESPRNLAVIGIKK